MNYQDLIKQEFKKLLKDPKVKTITIKVPNKKYIDIRPFKTLINKIIIQTSRKITPSNFKNRLMRLTGLKIGYDVCLPNDIIFDPYFPELITVEKGALVGGPNTLMAHEYKDGKLILGRVLVKKRTLVGSWSFVKPGAVINEKSILNVGSELNTEIPEGEWWGGRPAKLIAKFTKEDIDKYFKPTDGNYKAYYKDFKEKVKAFQRDKTVNFIKFHYNGKRLNAGDDWWKARNPFRILYNGVIIEITKLMGPSWLKNLLLRMVGVKLGKNVRIEKGVTFDHVYPDTITVGNNVKIGEKCELAGHEYTVTQTTFGRILIKDNVVLKDHAGVRTGTTIGENTIIQPYSFAQKEIPPNEVWGGVPIKFIKKRK